MNWKFNRPAGAAAPAAALAPAPAAAAPAAAPIIPAAHPLPPPVTAATLPAMQVPAAATATPGVETPAPRKTRRRASDVTAPGPTPAANPLATAAAAAPIAAVATPMAMIPAAPVAPTQNAPAVLPAGGWLSLFTPVDPGKTAGAAIAAVGEQVGGEPNIFPTIVMKGGKTGGMFDYDAMNEEGSDDDLPTGRKPFSAILLTYRILFLGWPAAYYEGGPKHTPRYQGVISANEGEAADLATAALKKYQFRTTRPDKGVPEPFYDSLCHPALAIEALMFLPNAGIIAARSVYSYDSLIFTNAQINGAFPKNPAGIPLIQPCPVTVEPESWQTAGSKKQPNGWSEHGIKCIVPVVGQVNPEITATVLAFQEFYSKAGMDADLGQAMSDWCEHTVTPQMLDVLRQIAQQ